MNYRHALLLSLLATACSERPSDLEKSPVEPNITDGTEQVTRTQRYQCGELSLLVELDGEELDIVLPDERRLSLQQSISASGARYTATTSDDTFFWSKGDTATLRIDGQDYPECLAQHSEQLHAHGNEPGWQLRLLDDTLELTLNYGRETRCLALHSQDRLANGVRYRAGERDQFAEVTVTEQLCSDTMSDLPYPLTVSLQLSDQLLRGCGGSPTDLLNHTQWDLLAIDDEPVIAESSASLHFDPNGRVTGNASCNRYTASWQLNGEALTISQAASTRMACPEPLMQQEQRFLAHLQGTRGFWINEQDQLELRSERGQLTAKRQPKSADDRPHD